MLSSGIMGLGHISMDELTASSNEEKIRSPLSSSEVSAFWRTAQGSLSPHWKNSSSDASKAKTELISDTQNRQHDIQPSISAEDLLSESKNLQVLGEFELLEKIGVGGVGVVYRARAQQTNEIVALKVIASHRLSGEEERRRFVLEAETASLLQHPQIVSVQGVGQEQGFHYMVMNYVESVTLSRLLDGQPIETAIAARLILSLSEVMTYVHQNGVLHRDLKPSNILVDTSGKPWLTDFGVAKRMLEEDWVTATGMLIGTPSYMAPEQIAGTQELVGSVSDVYALGAVLYEMLTGRPPFRSGTPFDTLQLALYTQPTPPRRYNSKIPKALEQICLKCLAKVPSQRYATAKELAEDLRAFLNQKPVSAKVQISSWGNAGVPWSEKTGLRDPEVLAQWGLVWKWNAWLLLVLFLGVSIAQWGDIQSEWTEMILMGSGMFLMGAIVWVERFHYAKPMTGLEWQVARLWLLFVCGALGVLLIGYQMDWSWSQLSPILLLFAAMGFGCMALFVDRAFALMTFFCVLFSILAITTVSLPPVLFGVAFALGLYIPARKYA